MKTSTTVRQFERILVFVIGVAVGVLASAVVPALGGASLDGLPLPRPGAGSSISSGPVGVTSIRFADGVGESFCAILADGSARCAGDEGWGELTPPAGVAFRDAVPGRETSCGVTVVGEVVCWGLWSGTVRTDGAVERIAFHDDISALCIIDDARRLICLAPPRTPRPQQYSVTGLRDLTRVSGNYLGACGLDPDGAVRCFAWDGSTRGDIRRFAPPEGLALHLVRLDSEFGCGIDPTGEVRCWGRAGRVAEAPSGPFVDLAMGLGTACALRTDGTVVCWGSGRTPQPPRGARFTSIAVNPWTGFACGATTRGEAICWGAGAYAALQRTLSTW